MGQVNVEEKDRFEEATNVTLADLAAIIEQVESQEFEENQELLQQEQKQEFLQQEQELEKELEQETLQPELGEQSTPLQPKLVEHSEFLQLVLQEEQASVLGNFLVGIHRPSDFSMHMVAMNLWKEEKHKLKKEIQKRDEEIEDKNVEIVALKERVDNMAALVPQILV